jgi:hypothetical protein
MVSLVYEVFCGVVFFSYATSYNSYIVFETRRNVQLKPIYLFFVVLTANRMYVVYRIKKHLEICVLKIKFF